MKEHNVGTAAGWGGFTAERAVYPFYFPESAEPQTLTLKDVPAKAFWSITVYDAEGYPQGEVYNINSEFAVPNEDGSMIRYFEYPHTVTAQDIDDLDHAGNYHYIEWMQHAAIAHSTANGWSPQKYIELGAGWVVRSHKITYLKPAFEGDSIIIKTWVSNMRSATSLRHYEILGNVGEILAKAETDWAFVNYEKQRPTRIPVEVSSCFVLTDV